MIKKTFYLCTHCGSSKTIIDNLLRNGNVVFQTTPDSLPCKCGQRAEKVLLKR